jgi:hypothetical protein
VARGCLDCRPLASNALAAGDECVELAGVDFLDLGAGSGGEADMADAQMSRVPQPLPPPPVLAAGRAEEAMMRRW